jgi:hypothetical protein
LAFDSASAAWRAASSAWRLASAWRHRLGRLGHGLGLVDLHEGALLAHLHLDRARLAGRVRLLDLRRLLAREGDLLLLVLLAVHFLQIVEQARLVQLGDRVLTGALLHAGRVQLLEQQRHRQLQLVGELGDVRLGHLVRLLLDQA